MSSLKCPNCGLTNFATETACKRCKQNLEPRSYPYWGDKGPAEQSTPDWSKLQTAPAVPGESVDLAEYGDGSHSIGNILFAIYLAVNIILMLYAVNYFSSDATSEIWKLVTAQKSRLYLASFEPMYYLALWGTIIFLPIAVVLLLTLFRKSRAFLTCVVIYLVAEFGYSLLSGWLFFKVEAEMREKHIPQFDIAADQIQWLPCLSLISILLTFVWFRYFTTSQRARSVFE